MLRLASSTGNSVRRISCPGYLFGAAPSDDEWRTQLACQTRLTVDATDALAVVREAWLA
jgi:hypothetical protein